MQVSVPQNLTICEPVKTNSSLHNSDRRLDSEDPNDAILDLATSHIDALRTSLARLDLSRLPRAPISDENVFERLPPTASAVYFLLHPTFGLLYIGKARDLQVRWRLNRNVYGEIRARGTHHWLKSALDLGGVEIAWWAVHKKYLTVVETVMIQLLSPKWNTHEQSGASRDGVKPRMRASSVGIPKTIRGDVAADEVELLVAAASNQRDRLIIQCGLLMGLRVSEICKLEIQNLNFHDGKTRVAWNR